MRHFKNPNIQSGQSFIEVVLTVFMVSSLLSAILLLQSNVFSNVTSSVSRMSRMILLQHYLYEIDLDWKLKKTTPAQKKIENPPTTIAYRITPPKEGSTLLQFKNISMVRLDATWDQAQRSAKTSLIALRYRVKKAES